MIFSIDLTRENEVDLGRNSKVVAGQKLALLENIDPNPSNVGAVQD